MPPLADLGDGMRDRKILEIIAALRKTATERLKAGYRGPSQGISYAAEFLRAAAEAEKAERKSKKKLGHAFIGVRKAAVSEIEEREYSRREFYKQVNKAGK